MCYVPIMAFSRSVESLCIITSSYSFRPLVSIPVAPTITVIIKHSLFHVRWIYVLRFLYLNSFPFSFCLTFLSDHVVRAISMQVLSLFVSNYYAWFICHVYVCLYPLVPQYCYTYLIAHWTMQACTDFITYCTTTCSLFAST